MSKHPWCKIDRFKNIQISGASEDEAVMMPRTCVAPSGRFVYGIHIPSFSVSNLRQEDHVQSLGRDEESRTVDNHINFPIGDIEEQNAEITYEIPNPFPFKGVTYILKSWAEAKAKDPAAIKLPTVEPYSFSNLIKEWYGEKELSDIQMDRFFQSLPNPLKLTLATTTCDPEDLIRLAEDCCEFDHHPDSGRPVGLVFEKRKSNGSRAIIADKHLYDAIANNVFLPDDYKRVMVLRPGAQGGSEIVGDSKNKENGSHVFEYLRRNSYIPWGHYAANMADDAIRYRIDDLTLKDMIGMRHLYYQRTFVRLADELGLSPPSPRIPLKLETLERLRQEIIRVLETLGNGLSLRFNCTLWGWNFGFDYAPSGYRLHASHQQIHQQYAMVPREVSGANISAAPERPIKAFTCGDMIQEFTEQYRKKTGKPFFDTYLQAIRNNQRLDGRNDRESSLIIHENDRVMLFVPKAQTSQWEIQLLVLDQAGNILEADTDTRFAIDRAMLIAMKILSAMGARMITVIEYAKRFDSNDKDQRLLYTFLPRLPESPGAFSEAQMRWINGHYPEDFAVACRNQLSKVKD
jgi:hypothetical protein